MVPRLLLDTHIVVRWLCDPKRLSRDQTRVLDDAMKRGESVCVSAITLLELSLLAGEPRRIGTGLHDLLDQLDANPVFRILPLTAEIAREVAALGDSLRDPSDRVIVATARVHRLRLITADQLIVESDLVAVVQ